MYFAVFKKRKLLSVICLIVLAITLPIILKTSGAYAVFYGGNLRKLPIYRVNTDEKKVAISFDCAWGVDYTDRLLEIMDSEDVKCTFFMVEFWAEKYPEYVSKINEFGHEIGTHSATHPYMSRLDKTAILKELESSTRVIEQITNKKVEVFRAPYGDYNDLLIDTAMEMGLYTIQWDVDSLDWKNLSASEIKNRVVSRVKNGSIVLFHNQGLHTAKALPMIIKELKSQGYKFEKIGDMIYRENYKMAVDGSQIKIN